MSYILTSLGVRLLCNKTGCESYVQNEKGDLTVEQVRLLASQDDASHAWASIPEHELDRCPEHHVRSSHAAD